MTYGTLRRVSSEEEHGAVNSGVEISKFSPASYLCRVRRVGLSHHTFNVEVTGSSPVRDTFFGIGYGDGRLCKSLADKFESCISHLFCLRNSVGLEYRAFNTGVASSSLAGGTYFTRLWWNGIITVSKTAVSSSNLGRRAFLSFISSMVRAPVL